MTETGETTSAKPVALVTAKPVALGTVKPVALVTGGARRLGRHISLALAPHFRVAVHYCTATSEASELADAHPGVHLFQADLTLPGAPDRLIAKVIEKTGQLDVLVNSAALFYSDEASLVQLAKMKTLNVDAPERLIAAARPYLAESRGQIINIADIAGIAPFSKFKAYSRSKSALIQMGAAGALELAREQIRINTICPGIVLPSPQEQKGDFLDTLQQQIPLQRIGTPADVANTVAFLASTNFITGQIIAVDGGRVLAALNARQTE